MKGLVTIIFLWIGFVSASAQLDSITKVVGDSSKKPISAINLSPTNNPVINQNGSDSLISKDKANIKADSLELSAAASDSIKKRLTKINCITRHPIDSFYIKLLDNPFFRTTRPPIFLIVNERKSTPKDELFYLICGLVFLLAFIKLAFSRYFSNITKLFFQPTFRQKQTKEQLLQSNLPSFLLNLFFILSAGVYVALLTQYYQLSEIGLWKLIIYISTMLLVLYTAKYIILSFAGWVFNVQEAVDSYSFIVFLVNKVLGILLLPFVIIIAFSKQNFIEIAIIISATMIAIMFTYRFIASFAPVMKEIKVGILHFLLYITALEVVPLLILYKMLLIYLYK